MPVKHSITFLIFTCAEMDTQRFNDLIIASELWSESNLEHRAPQFLRCQSTANITTVLDLAF